MHQQSALRVGQLGLEKGNPLFVLFFLAEAISFKMRDIKMTLLTQRKQVMVHRYKILFGHVDREPEISTMMMEISERYLSKSRSIQQKIDLLDL